MKRCRTFYLYYFFVTVFLIAFIPFVQSALAQELIPDWSSIEYAPFNLITPSGIVNPVLTADDVTDVTARFVADPFLFYENAHWYMFSKY